MPKKPTPRIPRFKSEREERAYWQRQDSAAVVDWAAARRMTLANLKPSTATISLRLPEIRIFTAGDASVLDRVAPGVFDDPVHPQWITEFLMVELGAGPADNWEAGR